MFKKLVAVAVTVLVTACSTPVPTHSPSPTPTTSSPSATVSPIVGCYVIFNGQNRYALQITDVTGNEFKGRLVYDNYHFDSSQGTYNGTWENNELFGVYVFVAEGEESARDMIFKYEDGNFIVGWGTYVTVGHYYQLQDRSTVVWDPKYTYSPADIKQCARLT
jgi:hypothetical protein